MNPTREEALLALALDRFVGDCVASRKQIALGERLEEPRQRQYANGPSFSSTVPVQTPRPF